MVKGKNIKSLKNVKENIEKIKENIVENKQQPSGIGNVLNSINNSKFVAGIVMILLNIGSKYITINLSKSQEEYLRNSIGHQILVFAIIWLGTRDIVISLVITVMFIVFTSYLFNENSKFCIVPRHWMKKFEKKIDLDEDGEITEDEINKAIKILEKDKKKNK